MSSRLFLANSSCGANAIRTTVEAPMLLGFGPASLSSGTTTLAGALLGRTPLLKLARRSLHTSARCQQQQQQKPLGTTLATTLRTNESSSVVRSSRCAIKTSSGCIGRRNYSGIVALSPSHSRSSCRAGALHCHRSGRLGTALPCSSRSLSSQSRRLQQQGGDNHGRDE